MGELTPLNLHILSIVPPILIRSGDIDMCPVVDTLSEFWMGFPVYHLIHIDRVLKGVLVIIVSSSGLLSFLLHLHVIRNGHQVSILAGLEGFAVNFPTLPLFDDLLYLTVPCGLS